MRSDSPRSMHCPHVAVVAAGMVVCALALLIEPANAIESFETPTTSWQLRDHDGPLRVGRHQRVFDVAHSGAGSEFVEFEAGNGTYFHLAHPIVSSLVHPELAAALWVRAERAGVRLLVRVVLPHAVDPKTKQPMTVLVGGSTYALPGRWQRLVVKSIDQSLRSQLRARRAQLQRRIDEREAYIDMVVVNAHQGPRLNRIWLDDLEVFGRVESRSPAIARAAQTKSVQVEVRGDTVVIDQTPRFIRMARYRGESLGVLRELGFNAIYTDLPATAALLAEAQAQQLWVVAGPPHTPHTPQPAASTGSQEVMTSLGPARDQLIAWSIGPAYTQSQASQASARALAARRMAPPNRAPRPVVGDIHRMDPNVTKAVDIALFGDATRHTSLDEGRYHKWLNSTKEQLAIPRWGRLELDPAPYWQQQLTQLGLSNPDALLPLLPQLRREAHVLLSSGVRGILVDTRRPLSSASNDHRACLVRLLNHELQLLSPWFAGGALQRLHHPDDRLRATQVSTARSRLLLVRREADRPQFTATAFDAQRLSLVAPPLGGASRGFRISRGRLESFLSRRVPGGDHFKVDDAEHLESIVLSADPLVLNHLSRSLLQEQETRAQAMLTLAGFHLGMTAETLRRIQSNAAAAKLEELQSQLRKAKADAVQGRHQAAYNVARTIEHQLAEIRRAAWTAELAGRDPMSSPPLGGFGSLPLQRTLDARVRDQRWSPNLLPGSNLEKLDLVTRSGWVNHQPSLPNWHSDVSFIGAAKGGQACLRLACTSVRRGDIQPNYAPVVLHSAPLQLRAGQIARVAGWVKAPYPIESLDGLLIYDNAGGRDMAMRIHSADQWQHFEFTRTIWKSGPFVVSWELAGSGEAWIDEVSVSVHNGAVRDLQETAIHMDRPPR